MAHDLRFKRPLDTSHPVDLIFGEDETDDESVARVSFAITLSPPATTITLASFIREALSFSIAMPPPSTFISLDYDNAVSRGPQAIAKSRWQEATPKNRDVEMTWDKTEPLAPDRSMVWGTATPVPSETESSWGTNTPLGRRAAVVWEEATPRPSGLKNSTWKETDHSKQRLSRTVWQEATHRPGTERRSFWDQMTPHPRPATTLPWGLGAHRFRELATPFQTKGIARNFSRRFPWEEARRAPPGRSQHIRPEPPEPDPCYTPPPGHAVPLIFTDLLDGSSNLLFICDNHMPEQPALVVVPVRRVYMVINETSLWRVDGMVMLPATNVSMSLDVDSWTWSFSASLPAYALPDVEPNTDGDPVELEVRINGVNYRVLAEGISRDRSFPTSKISIRGRGRTALLDAPYAPVVNYGNTDDRTAQQLMSDVLSINGVPLGWDVDWNLADWLVPGGVWSGQGTYIQALNQIAAAAGGYIQPHRTADSLFVLPRYPVAPWDWATEVEPDFELPSAVTTRESIEWTEKIRYNRVFVSGQRNGVLGQVTREGTAGDTLAAMVVDPLITHVDAARQRGLSILADTGRQADVTLRLPVLEETGLILPGKFVRYVDGGVTRLGIVRSTSVDIQSPAVWQNIGVETHVSP